MNSWKKYFLNKSSGKDKDKDLISRWEQDYNLQVRANVNKNDINSLFQNIMYKREK